jgi:predicted tellurium resistance membrane protein TerC
MLLVEEFNPHIAKGYIYFAMAFSVLVEVLNLKLNHRAKPVELNQRYR